MRACSKTAPLSGAHKRYALSNAAGCPTAHSLFRALPACPVSDGPREEPECIAREGLSAGLPSDIVKCPARPIVLRDDKTEDPWKQWETRSGR